MLKKARKVFFVGIGGIGISAIARMFLLEGRDVSGSDISESEITDELKALGAEVVVGQGIELIPEGVHLIVYTVAIEKYAVDFLADLKSLGIPLLSYPQALREISKNKFTIAIAGTHGKTTTTAMVAKVLLDAGLDPTVIIGSILIGEKSNFIAGKSKYFVVEADEYRRGFHNLSPTILAINNIDEDHLDYYKDLADIQSAFGELALTVPKAGFVITNKEHPHIAPVVKKLKAPVLHYPDADIQGLKLKVGGEHNRSNAKVALRIAEVLGIALKKAKKSLSQFLGTARRFEYKGTMKNGALLYDDYAHNPQKVLAAILGARETFPDKKIIVVFQPHLYSRTKHHLDAFANSLATADKVILAPIFAARESFDRTVSSGHLAKKIMRQNKNVTSLKDFSAIIRTLKKSATKKDLVILMGAGDIYKIAEKLVDNSRSV